MPASRLVVALAVTVLVAGCSLPRPRLPRLPGVYRIDIQQGNVVTQEMLDRLEPGMTKRKVRLVLGTPMIADPFNQQRWDYIYTFLSGSGELTRRRVSLYFRDQRLEYIDGDIRTGPPEPGAPPLPREEVVTVPPREKTGFLDKITPGFLKRDKRAAPPEPGGAEGVAGEAPASEEAGAPAQPPAAASAADTRPEEAGAGEAPASTAVATPQAGETPAAATASTGEADDEDTGLLKRLFRRFRTSPQEDQETAGADTPESQAGRDEPSEGAEAVVSAGDADGGPSDDGAEATGSEDDGFFSRLMKRFRRTPKPAPETPETAPAAQPTRQE